MANNNINNGIDPRLEQIMKEELNNRAKKLEAIKQWEQASATKNENKSKLKIIYGAVSGMAAMLLVGIFFFRVDGDLSVGESELIPESMGVPVFRGAMFDPTVYDTLEAGDTLQAIHMIDSLLLESHARLQQLDSIEITTDNLSEIQDLRIEVLSEIEELVNLKNSLY